MFFGGSNTVTAPSPNNVKRIPGALVLSQFALGLRDEIPTTLEPLSFWSGS
jgi:hypothetical protein